MLLFATYSSLSFIVWLIDVAPLSVIFADKYIGERITKGANVYTILIINSDGIDEDARIYADDIYYVNRKEYVDWAIKALTVVRSVWCTFSGEGESEWREFVHKEFIKAGITPKDYLDFVCSKNLKDK